MRDLSRVRGTDGRDWEGDAEETDERVGRPRRREYVAAGNKREMQQELRRADFKRNSKVRETREDATERGECRGEETDDATRRRQIKLEEFKELVHFYRRSVEPRATVRSEQSESISLIVYYFPIRMRRKRTRDSKRRFEQSEVSRERVFDADSRVRKQRRAKRRGGYAGQMFGAIELEWLEAKTICDRRGIERGVQRFAPREARRW